MSDAYYFKKMPGINSEFGLGIRKNATYSIIASELGGSSSEGNEEDEIV